jgi:hypothetical protein
MSNQKVQCVAVSAKHLHLFELEENIFLEQTVTCHKTWMHHFTQVTAMSLQVISTTQKIQEDIALGWQDRGKCFEIQKE